MQQIPLSAVPSQTLKIVLDGQSCQIAAYQKQPIVDEYGVAAGLFFDLSVAGTDIIETARCLDRTPILQDRRYLVDPFGLGDFMFLDTTATQGGPPTFNGAPPYYTGLGSQFVLLYLSRADIIAANTPA